MKNSLIREITVDSSLLREAIDFIRLYPKNDFSMEHTINSAAQALHDELGDVIHAPTENYIAHLIRFKDFTTKPNDLALSILTTYFGKSLRLGQPFGITEESNSLFQSIEPKPDAPDNSNATAGDFGFHSDNAALMSPFHPEIISLTCINNDAHAETGIIDAETIYSHLAESCKRASLQYRFSHESPPSFGDQCIGNSEARPLFIQRTDGLRCAMTTYRTRPHRDDDDLALLTLVEVERIAKERAIWIDLQPGEILFFRNDQSLHARKPIDGTRKLLRAYWRRSLTEFRIFASTNNPFLFSAEKAFSAGKFKLQE